MKRMRSLGLAMAAAGLCVVVAPAVLWAGGTTTYAPKDCDVPRVEPTRIIIACGDAAAYVNRMRWAHWGQSQARGHGKLRLNDCTPSCAEGDFHKYATKARLLHPHRTRCDGRRVRLFNHLNLRFPHRKPPNAHSLRKNGLYCDPS